jgi:S1-C subfamily serine protease
VAGALVLALASCGGGDDSQPAGPQKVVTTKVQVVEGVGAKGGFNAEGIYRRLSPGVVTILSLFDGGASLLGGDGEGGQGSGFVLDAQGYIATNAHVVTNGRAHKRAKQVFVEFSDGNRVPAKIIGADPFADVALIKVAPRGLSLTPIALGSSRNIVVGEPVAAIGSPFGERQSLTTGVISAIDRNIESLTAFQIGNAIQTDAAINPGNSGGPLLDAHGRVLGINAQIRTSSGGGEGVGFAIPVDAVRRSVRELRRHGRVDYGFLGVTTAGLYPQLAKRAGVSDDAGALVQQVEKNSPAAKAGIKAGDKEIDFQGQRNIKLGGDVIVAVDGRRLTRREDLADVISARDAGDQVTLEIVRGGERRTVRITLGHRPDRPAPG